MESIRIQEPLNPGPYEFITMIIIVRLVNKGNCSQNFVLLLYDPLSKSCGAGVLYFLLISV